jgi:hypothetical protein
MGPGYEEPYGASTVDVVSLTNLTISTQVFHIVITHSVIL